MKKNFILGVVDICLWSRSFYTYRTVSLHSQKNLLVSFFSLPVRQQTSWHCRLLHSAALILWNFKHYALFKRHFQRHSIWYSFTRNYVRLVFQILAMQLRFQPYCELWGTIECALCFQWKYSRTFHSCSYYSWQGDFQWVLWCFFRRRCMTSETI